MKTTKSRFPQALLVMALLLLLSCGQRVHATTNIALPFYEPFAYPGNNIKLGNDALNGSDS